jgi:uncharacterized membrane protein (DUF373 family)
MRAFVPVPANATPFRRLDDVAPRRVGQGRIAPHSDVAIARVEALAYKKAGFRSYKQGDGMERGKSEQPDFESGWVTRYSGKVFHRIEIAAYLVLGLLLAAVAVIGTASAIVMLFHAMQELGVALPLVETIDRILLVLMVIEILHTVRVSFNEGALVCEPFLIVGLIASIRRMLVITLESAQAQEPGKWTPEMQGLFYSSMVELVVLGGLIIAMVWSIYLLRRSNPPHADKPGH